MSFELKIPSLGESITEVQISEWLKAEGDEVKKDESVAVLDSEKSTLELPAPESGRLVKILYQAGEAVKIGETVAHIETTGDSTPAKAGGKTSSPAKLAPEKPRNTPAETAPPPGDAPTQEPAATQGDSPDRDSSKAAPVAQKPSPEDAANNRRAIKNSPASSPPNSPTVVETAEENSVQAESTGERPAQNSRTDEVVPMTMLRRTVARRLVEAKQQMAMLTTFNEVDMTAVQSLRQTYQTDFEKRYEIRLGLMGFFVKAVIDALKQFPALNAEVRENNIVYHNYFDIGVAIASGRGLVVPVLRNAERLSFAEVESAIASFVGRAKEGQIKPDELEGGTFTITNGGVFGSLLSTPIINPPQTGILGMHTIQDRPIALLGQVVIRPMMNLALTYDHRVVDGREAVLFLRRVKEVIEMPARMLIEI